MNKAKILTVDINGNMVRNTQRHSGRVYNEIEPCDFTDELRLVKVGWQNSGVYYEFKGSECNTYYMSQQEFDRYLEMNEVKIYGNFEFLKQGAIQSIGYVKGE